MTAARSPLYRLQYCEFIKISPRAFGRPVRSYGPWITVQTFANEAAAVAAFDHRSRIGLRHWRVRFRTTDVRTTKGGRDV